MASCPNRDELQGLLENRISETRVEVLENHIESCDECQRALDNLSDENAVNLPLPAVSPSVSGDSLPAEVADRLSCKLREEIDSVHESQIQSLSQQLPADRVIGAYVLLDEIGRGGMGVVYRARHIQLDRIVAIKVLTVAEFENGHSDAVRIGRFQRELRAIGRLRHPNIVAALDAGKCGSYHYLALEFIDGVNLQQLVQSRGPLKPASACEIIRQAATGLQHCHEAGLVHRDIKPSNIMLSVSEGVPTARILDLGLAQIHKIRDSSEEPLTRDGLVLGTLNYMAPEQFGTSQVDIRADIYALGATLFFLLTGRPHIQHEGSNLLEKIRHRALEPQTPLAIVCPSLPRSLSSLVDSMLANQAANRPDSPGEIAKRLIPLCSGHQIDLLMPTERTPNDIETLRMAESATQDEVVHENLMNGANVSVGDHRTDVSGGFRPRIRHWLLSGFAIAFIALVGIIIRLKTDGGDIVIACNDPNIELQIVRNDEPPKSFVVGQIADHTWFRSGKYEIRIPRVPKAIVTIENERFSLVRGDKKLVTIFVDKTTKISDPKQAVQTRRSLPAARVIEVFGAIESADNLAWQPSADQQDFLDQCGKLPSPERAQAVIRKVLELNPLAPAPVTQFQDGNLVGLEWGAGQLGLIWPLAALSSLETLKMDVDCVSDYRPLLDLPLRELQTHVSVANTTAIATLGKMKKLETINSGPKDEFISGLVGFRNEINVFQSKKHRLSTNEQARWIEDILRRLNPGIALDPENILKDSFKVVYHNEQKWDHFRFCRVKGLRDLSPIAIFDPPIVRMEECPQFYDLSPFQVMKSLKGLWIEGSSIHDPSPIKNLQLDSLTLTSANIRSLEFVKNMPLKTFLKVRDCPVDSLEPIRGKFLERLEIDDTQVVDLDPVRGMPLEFFSGRNIPSFDFSPLKGMQLRETVYADRRYEARLINDLDWLVGVPAPYLIVDPPRRYYKPDLDVLRKLNCARINFVVVSKFWQNFEADLARIEKYTKQVKSHDVAKRQVEVGRALVDAGFNGPGTFTIQDGKITGIVIELRENNDGLWPLRPLEGLRSLKIGKGVPQKFDLSALIDMKVESLLAPSLILEQNMNVLRRMKSLKSVNGRPANELLNQ